MSGLWTLTKLRARTRARMAGRLPARGQDRGSMTMALLVGLIGSGIAAILIPMLVVQIGSTSFDNSRAREMNAAEAGTAVAVGMVRSATDGTDGVINKLPCTTTAPITGTVDGDAAGMSYRVSIGYYTVNPTDLPDSQLVQYNAASAPNAYGMLCVPGAGTYYPPKAPGNNATAAEQVPSYVLITSTGLDGQGSRTLRSTYYVKTTNQIVLGGTIQLYSTGTLYCMDAGLATGSPNYNVETQVCTKPVQQQQAWVYRTDLSIQLVSSVTQGQSNGLCLTDEKGRLAGAEAGGDPVVLESCSALGQAPWYQMWSVDNSGHLQGAKPSAPAPNDLNGLCINSASNGTGLTLATCTGLVTDTNQTWVPSPDVGSGMAGPINHEFVNFQQPSSCIDVTGADPTSAFLIAYTCKQDPDPDAVEWNQKFAFNSQGQMVTNDNGTNYCLYSPLSPYASATNGPWVKVVPCAGAALANTTWTQYGATDANDNPLTATDKYKIKDSLGECLSLTLDSAAFYNVLYPKIIVEGCRNGDDPNNAVQMWNGAPDTQLPSLTNFREVDTQVAP